MITTSSRTLFAALRPVWILCIAVLSTLSPMAQTSLTQHIRGTVIDQTLQKPIAGATVALLSLNRSVVTDSLGNFSFGEVPVGRQQLRVTHIGFRESLQEDLTVEAGKEAVLNISLEVAAHTENDVVVRANSRKNRPLNEMSLVSARAFSVEETQKYAAAINDPLRMATSFAGVATPMDGNNDIVIRGNSPTGLLWRMEGVEIPNPNHFSNPASSGGGISILSAQLLANSDFLTGAFPAEYGDALSGVFDLNLRKGNNEKKEYTLQAGFLGLDATAEGPFRPSYKGSFLVNYRYSTLALLGKMGLDLPSGDLNFQDLSYNIYLPTRRAGTFSLFGFGGLSTQVVKPKQDSSKWKQEDDRYSGTFSSTTGMSGLTHKVFLAAKTSLYSVLALSYNGNSITQDYVTDAYTFSRAYRSDDKTPKWTLTSTLNHTFREGSLLRAGYVVNLINYNYYQQDRKAPDSPLLVQVDTRGNTQTIQAFVEWQGRIADRLTFNMGAHYLELLYNHSRSLEPRSSLKWELGNKSSLAFGYGLHSQIQALGVYFAQDTNAAGSLYHPNTTLGLTRAHHFVLSYNYKLSKDLNLKTEVYYQYLFNVPVNASDTNTFSTLNIESSDYVSDPLVNKGTGRNYGIEITLEKFLSRNLYYMINGSFYQSRYTALDGIERNTRFDGNYLVNITAGKDFVRMGRSGKARTFGINIRTIWSGGYRTTPVNLQQSELQQTTVEYQQLAYTLRNPAYFRTDLRLSMKKDYRHVTTILSLDLQDLTNQQNIYGQSYDIVKKQVVTVYQARLIPVLNYKIEF